MEKSDVQARPLAHGFCCSCSRQIKVFFHQQISMCSLIMYVRMYVCMYVCMCVCVCIQSVPKRCIHTGLIFRIIMCIHIFGTPVYMCLCVHLRLCMHIYIYVYVCVYICLYLYICVCVCMYICVCARVCTHARTYVRIDVCVYIWHS
jgi:hypothetical protein